MTIANLLKLHGHNVQRAVSPTGRMIFRNIASTAAATAAKLASPMPIKPHTFHGGANPVEKLTTTPEPWWFDDEVMDRDRKAMALYFPGFTETPATKVVPPSWVGTIDTGYGVFGVRMQHRLDHGLPAVVPDRPKRRLVRGMQVDSPHLFLSGNLCVANADDWDPSTDTIATVVGWTAHWHAAYVDWNFTGIWPMEGYESDAA